jgi:hypothetical protein
VWVAHNLQILASMLGIDLESEERNLRKILHRLELRLLK